MVDQRCTDADLLPPLGQQAVRNPRLDDVRDCHAYACAAIAADAYASAHHKVSRLCHGGWACARMFDELRSVCLTSLPPDAKFDEVVARHAQGDRRPLFARTCAIGGNAAYMFVFADRLTAVDRIRAVVPLVLRTDLEAAILVNLRTGERQRLVVDDRDAFWEEMHQE